jgi:hypothetical protein
MSFQPYDRNPSGIVFFGTGAGDQLFESNSNFTIDGTTLVATNLAVSDGGTIGSASDADAITIASNGDVTFSQDISIAGNLTVNGTTTTVNSTIVTIDDPIFTLGGDTAPASDDNKDRGIEFNWHNGSTAKVGFFGFDDSTGKFTFIPDATNTSEVFSGAAGTIVADLEGDVTGNADTASAWATSRTITLGDELSGNVSIDGSANVTLNASLTAAAITGLTEMTTGISQTDDYIMIYDNGVGLKKINRSNFVSGLGAMSSFTVTADSGTDQQVDDGETLDIAGGTGLETAVGATNTVTVSISAGGVDTTQLAADAVTGAKIADDAVDSEHLVDGSVDNVHLAGNIAFAKLDGGAYLTSAEAFSDSDTQLMTAAAIDDRILSYGYSTTDGTVTSVGGTGSVNGITLTGTVTSAGNLTLGGTLGNITVSQLAGSAVITSAESFSDDDTTLMTSAAIDDRILSYGYTTTTGTVTSITAGTGLSGGTITTTGTIAIANGGVDTLQLAADAVDGTKIADDAVNSEHIANGAIDLVHMSANSVDSDQYVDGSIDRVHLSADIIDGSKLEDDAVNSEHIADGAIDLVHMSANSVDSDQYVDGSIDTVHVSAGAITEAKRTRTVSSPTTSVTLSDDINLCSGGAGGITVTLPAVASGKVITIKKKDSAAGVVTIQRGGSATIDGATTKALYHQYESMTLASDGTDWYII